MSNVDVAWLRMDEPTNLMMVNGVLVFDRPLAMERVRAVVERRMLPIPRFRQRVVRPARGRPHWEDAADFRLDDHLSRTALPGDGGDAALAAEVSRLMSTPLDYSRPLWSFHLLDNYRGGTAVMGRFHHCIGDGVALMLVLLSLTDLAAEVAAAEGGSESPLTDLFTPGACDLEAARRHAERVMPETMRLMLHPVEALRSTRRWLVRTAATGSFGKLVVRRPDPKTPFKGRLSTEKRAAWSDPVPLAEVRAVKAKLGGTINDLLLTAMTGGLRRYLAARGGLKGRLDFRAAVPVNLRPLENMVRLGNEFGLVFLPLPVGVDDPVARLAELRRRMETLKRSAESVMVLGALRLMGMTPQAVQRLVVRFLGTKATAVMTNVPGPKEVLYFDGAPIKDIFFWVPQSGRVGMGISIFSYAGNARLGVATDVALVPDPERIIAGFHEEFDAMRRLAGVGSGAADPAPVAAAPPDAEAAPEPAPEAAPAGGA
jgi:WS/DGAT/MGAT family acyltransferase